jgi:hypothetical protein
LVKVLLIKSKKLPLPWERAGVRVLKAIIYPLSLTLSLGEKGFVQHFLNKAVG